MQHPLLLSSEAQRKTWLARLLVYAMTGVLVGPLVLGGAMILKQIRIQWWWRLVLTGLAVVWTIWLSGKISQATTFEAVIGWVWLAVPLVALGLHGLDTAIFHLRPRSLDEHLVEVQQRLQRDEERASSKGKRQAAKDRVSRKGQLNLGPVIRGGYLPKWVGMGIDSHQWLTKHESVLK